MATREEIIFSEIKNNPGIRFRELMKKVGITNGVMSHYLRKLEENESVWIERTPRVTRFYSSDLSEDEVKLVKRLRQETPKKILVALVENDQLTFKELVLKIAKSPSTTSFYLSQLVKENIINTSKSASVKIYFNTEKKRIANLIGEYHPDIIEQSSDNWADIISSL
jgi:predicted transcriptional regulator